MKCASDEISLIFWDSIVKETMNSFSINETSSLASPQQVQGESASVSCNCFHPFSKATAKSQIPGKQVFLQGSSCLWQWLCTPGSRAIVILMCHHQFLTVVQKKKVPSCRTALLMSLHIVPHWCFLELEGRQEAAVWDVMDGYSQIVTHWNSQGERWYGMGQGSEKEFYKLSLI